MQEWSQLNTISQSEALTNELKGNLLEFLVALNLAKAFGRESHFYGDLDPALKKRLSEYEVWLRENNPLLIQRLPILAKACSDELLKHLPLKADRVLVLGKLASLRSYQFLKEADLLVFKEEETFPISLKLCKLGAFVNTKSAGILSFLAKYFSPYFGELALKWQERINEQLEQSFEMMWSELYHEVGLEYRGGYDSRWCEAGLSELPGQLEKNLQALVLAHYQRMIEVLYQAFCDFFEDPQALKKALAPIVGLGHPHIIQLTCFHSGTESYEVKKIKLYQQAHWEEDAAKLQLGKRPSQLASFEIQLGKSTLQIRVKPMNKFVHKALKINCSFK